MVVLDCCWIVDDAVVVGMAEDVATEDVATEDVATEDVDDFALLLEDFAVLVVFAVVLELVVAGH